MRLIKKNKYYHILHSKDIWSTSDNKPTDTTFLDVNTGLVVKQLTKEGYTKITYDTSGRPILIKTLVYKRDQITGSEPWTAFGFNINFSPVYGPKYLEYQENRLVWEGGNLIIFEDHKGNWFDKRFMRDFMFGETSLIGLVSALNSKVIQRTMVGIAYFGSEKENFKRKMLKTLYYQEYKLELIRKQQHRTESLRGELSFEITYT